MESADLENKKGNSRRLPDKTAFELPARQRAARGAGIGGVNFPVDQTIGGHAHCPEGNHGNRHSGPNRPAGLPREHQAQVSKWEGKNRMLNPDHFKKSFRLDPDAHENPYSSQRFATNSLIDEGITMSSRSEERR